MITAVAFVLAAALGALARAEAGRRWNRQGAIPAGTLVVNVTGSFLLGLLVNTTPPVVTVLGVGCLGAYTTFSSVASETVALAGQRRLALAGAYIAATLALGVAAAAIGVAVAA